MGDSKYNCAEEEYFSEEGEQEEFAFGHDVLSNDDGDDGHLADDFLQGGSGDEGGFLLMVTSIYFIQ